jgi:hypothetical protein
MQITINLEPEMQAAFQKEADAAGLRFEAYLQVLLQRAFHNKSLISDAETRSQKPSPEEFERDWAAFSEPIEGLPPVRDEDLSREVIYADHD